MTDDIPTKASVYTKLYRERHPDKVIQSRKAYRERNPDHYTKYYAKNKEAIREKRQEYVMCNACNYEVTRESMRLHKRSQTHKANIGLVPDDSGV